MTFQNSSLPVRIDVATTSGNGNHLIDVPLDIGSSQVTVTNESFNPLSFSKPISDAGNSFFDYFGPGTAIFSADNTYTGSTGIDDGTLLVDGSQPGSSIGIANGTLGGAGAVGDVFLGGRGSEGSTGTATISPGASTAILTVNSLNASTGTTLNYDAEINGTTAGSGYDQIKSLGDVDITGVNLNLTIANGFQSPFNTSLKLVDDGGSLPVMGTFQSVTITSGGSTQGGPPPTESGIYVINGQSYVLSYQGGDGNDITLTERNTTPLLSAPGTQSATAGNVQAIRRRQLLRSRSGQPLARQRELGRRQLADLFRRDIESCARLPQSHTYANSSTTPYVVTVELTDAHSPLQVVQFQVNVANVAPVITPPANQFVVPGSSSTINLGSFTDPGTDQP